MGAGGMTKSNSKTSKELAEETYAQGLKMSAILHGTGNVSADVDRASLLAKNILDEELGAFNEGADAPLPYLLDESRRDKLLRNARQDIVSIYSLAVRANYQLYELKRMLVWIAIVTAITVLGLTGLLFREFL